MDSLPSDPDSAWRLLKPAAAMTERLVAIGRAATFGLDEQGEWCEQPECQAALGWDPQHGWRSLLPRSDPRAEWFALYLPVCSAHLSHPITIGHLGQSLDGFVATANGESCFVTGPENILHLHRLRALSDAVIVGAGTVAADNPRLTTRLVTGSNPVRVVLDAQRRLKPDRTVFSDGAAETVRVSLRCARPEPNESAIQELEVGGSAGDLDLRELRDWLHARGCARILIEGGGITVSRFLQWGLLDRLQVAVAPLLIGSGRRGVQVPAKSALADCLRLQAGFFRMGNDMLYDCPLR